MQHGVRKAQISFQPDSVSRCAQPGDRWILWGWLSVLVVVSGGCATGPLTLLDWYTPPRITPLAHLGTIAVAPFMDRRERAQNTVGAYTVNGHFRGSSPVLTSEPVGVSVTWAIAEGLKLRGFSVPTATDGPVASPSHPNAIVTVSGDVLDFWATSDHGPQGRLGVVVAGCQVRLRVSEVVTGRQLWEKEYSKQYVWRPGMPGRERLDMGPALATVLALTVEGVVYDPEFIRELRRR